MWFVEPGLGVVSWQTDNLSVKSHAHPGLTPGIQLSKSISLTALNLYAPLAFQMCVLNLMMIQLKEI